MNTETVEKMSKSDVVVIDDNDIVISIDQPNKESLAHGSIYNLLKDASFIDKIYLVVGIATAVLSGANQPANLILFGNILNSFNTASSQEQNNMVTLLAILYVVMAAQMFITQLLQTASMTTLAANQTIRLRKAYFQSLLRQPVSFFDTQDQGTRYMHVNVDNYFIYWTLADII